MSRPDSLVDGIRNLSPFSKTAGEQEPLPPIDYRKVEFRGGRSGILDVKIPRSRAWADIIDSRQKAGLPVYVEIDPETEFITELLIPRTMQVGVISDVPAEDRVYIEFIGSAVLHYLQRSNPDFTHFYTILKTAADNGSGVLVTDVLAGNEIIDIQTSPELLKDPFPKKKPPTDGSPAPGPSPGEGPSTVSLQRAQQLFNQMAARSCDPLAVPPPCITFLYPFDGCHARAHEMCRLMIAEGEQPRKVWLYGHGYPYTMTLSVNTRNAPACSVPWNWHVAPTLEVDSGGVIETYVIDPSLFTSPVTIAAWKAIQNDGTATPEIEDDTTVYLREKGGLPAGKTYDASYTLSDSTLQYFRQQLHNESVSPYGPPPYSSCPVTPDCFFILDRSTFGQDEVGAMLRDVNPGYPGTLTAAAVIRKALYVVVEGFKPSELGINSAADLNDKNLFPVITPNPNVAGLSIKPGTPTDPVEPEDPSLPDHPQRFTFPYQVEFENENGFGFSTDTLVVTLTASRTSTTGKTVSNVAAIELIKNANPFMIDGAVSWLSTDVRVFQIKQNDQKFGSTMGSDAPAFIQAVITNLNAGHGTAGTDTFVGLPTDQPASSLALAQTDANGIPVFNFAVARVRLKGYAMDAQKVRVFFRLFATQRTSMDYDYPSAGYPNAGSYRFSYDGIQFGKKIPLPGVIADEYVSIPCFAQERVVTSTNSMTQQNDSWNVRDINHLPGGAETDAYYGCWLDTNQPLKKVLPEKPPAANIDGPFGSVTLLSVLEAIVKSGHQCLIAEVAFDLKAIPPGATPAASDKLAQRNLAFGPIANPGKNESRSISQTFEVRPTPAVLKEGQKPDELMIEWGNVPAGSIAQVYLPAANAPEILRMARKMYTSYRLLLIDDHTLRFPAAGVTYIPIPAGSGSDYAGLLTVDFPRGVKKGQRYSVVVRQVSGSVRQLPVVPTIRGETAAVAGNPASWRRIIGSFQVIVPVQAREELLVPEQRLLSILRWIQKSIPAESRWSPVFRRHVGQVAGRVDALGGNSQKVEASPTGDWQGAVANQCRRWGWLTAALLAGTAAALGALSLTEGLVMAVLFIISATGWIARCRQRLCSVLRVLVAGIGTGALVLAILALAGSVSPQLIVVLTMSVILTGIIALYGALSECW